MKNSKNRFLYLAIKRKYRLFNKLVKEKSSEWGCNNFSSFLFYNITSFASPAYKYLFFAPKIYLANSKSFRKYWDQLDKDFQTDLITTEQIKNSVSFLKEHPKFLQWLKKNMKEDSIL